MFILYFRIVDKSADRGDCALKSFIVSASLCFLQNILALNERHPQPQNFKKKVKEETAFAQKVFKSETFNIFYQYAKRGNEVKKFLLEKTLKVEGLKPSRPCYGKSKGGSDQIIVALQTIKDENKLICYIIFSSLAWN